MTAPIPPLVFPLGHYVGAFHPDIGAPLKYRKIRIGVEVEQLPGEELFGVWALAHGLPDRVGRVPWTRDSVIAVAGEMGIAKAEDQLEQLIERHLLAEVTPGTPQAAEFARGHRIQPLMLGLGNSPEDPLTFSLGFVGTPPAVKVNSFLYELWQWGRVTRSLWLTAEMFAQVEQKVSPDNRQSSPAGILDRMLQQLHILLAHNAAYLDAVLEPAQLQD
jgi:hypothetical protein